ncbi:IQ motif and ubiquitin-like domain-containing protein [Ptychodera flava]|uniref:IQ motif and ubiquitin-like domain-containing protein n=1 Tax=Ptychodera flava TaxID=63121 RepID=UPI00396A4AB6
MADEEKPATPAAAEETGETTAEQTEAGPVEGEQADAAPAEDQNEKADAAAGEPDQAKQTEEGQENGEAGEQTEATGQAEETQDGEAEKEGEEKPDASATEQAEEGKADTPAPGEGADEAKESEVKEETAAGETEPPAEGATEEAEKPEDVVAEEAAVEETAQGEDAGDKAEEGAPAEVKETEETQDAKEDAEVKADEAPAEEDGGEAKEQPEETKETEEPPADGAKVDDEVAPEGEAAAETKEGEAAPEEGEAAAETKEEEAAPEEGEAAAETKEEEAAPEEGEAAAETKEEEAAPEEGEAAAETKEGEAAPEEEAPAGVKEEEAEQKEEAPAETKEAEEEKKEDEVPKETEQTKETVGAETEDTGEKHEVDPHAESPTPRTSMSATATVKFVLMPSGQVTTLACALGQTIGDLKRHFSVELKMPVAMLVLMFDGKAMADDVTLAALGVDANATVQLEMTSADPVNTPLKPMKPKPEYVMPDVVTVRVQRDDGTIEDVVVEIERATRRKAYLGGYRHRVTGKEYHHASAQTRPKIRPDNGIEKFCRDTQTVEERHQRQQTKIDTSTQMTGIGVYVSNMTDKLMVPGRYTTADEHHAMIIKNVIILQSYFRRWKAKRTVENLKEDLARRLEWEREEEVRKIKEKGDRIKREFERRMNPKSKEDFDLLYHALEKWRQEELEVINATMTGAQRKAALCHLLDQETQLIAAIGRHKLQADTENKQRRIEKFLDKCAAPKKWRAFDGKKTEMDTQYTIRARELKDIYNSINMKYLTQDERLDVLLTLKHTVKEHDCKLTQDIIELIDREADLLMRGVQESNLEGLRKRISTLFLQYIKTPTFNAEAARLLKVPQDPSTLRKNIYFCPSCNKYLPSTEFSLSSNARVVGKCRACAKLDNDGRIRQDYSHYRFLLKNLRKAEEAFGDDSRIAFLLQEVDMRYLVENIWASQSALSAWDDLYDLVLVRWDKTEEWSPWNCILLTKDEAAAHLKLEEVEESYGRVFCHKIRSKQTLSRNYFSRLPGMAEHMRKKASQPKPGHSLGSRAVTFQSTKA